MTLPRIALTTVSFLFALASWCQLDVYKSYEDYTAHKGKSYGDVEFKKWKGDDNTVLVFERKGKEDVEIQCANIWGFAYKESLFRVSKDSKYFVKKGGVQVGAPFVVIYLDEVVYYQNGLGVLDAMKHDRSQFLLKGMCAALSKDLNSDMAVVPCTAAKWTDEQILLLLRAYPELKALAGDLDALKKSSSPLSSGVFTYEQVRTFVRDFIENKQKKEN